MTDSFDPAESETVITAPDGWRPQAGASSAPVLDAPRGLGFLDDDENALVAGLADVWARHNERNRILTAYYEAKEPLVDFSTTVPKSIKRNFTPLGWARKAVDMLAELCVFDGFVAPGRSDPFDLTRTMGALGFAGVLQQAIQTALIHGCSFLTVLQDATGAPVLRTHTAENAAALWDWPARRVKACMAVTDQDRDGNATGIVLYLPRRVVSAHRDEGGRWEQTGGQATVDGVCPVWRLAYKPTETKPFGRSRISPDAMRLIDAANRALVRAEANAEYYAWPKIFLLGASRELAEASPDDALRMYMGRYQIVSKDGDGDSPTVTQLSASSMEPHLSMVREYAAMFASAMNIPASSLGVVADSNPTSADAVDAQREDLIIEAQRCDRDFGDSVLEAARLIVRMTTPDATQAELDDLQCDWRNPNTPSLSMSADSFTKFASAIDGFATSEVGLSCGGFSRSQIIRILAAQKTAQQTGQGNALAALLSGGAATSGESNTGTTGTASEVTGGGSDTGPDTAAGAVAEPGGGPGIGGA